MQGARVDRVVVVGAGAYAREVLDVIDAMSAAGHAIAAEGVVTETTADGEMLAARGISVLGGLEIVEDGRLPYVIAIGDSETRRRIDERLRDCGARSPVLVHPTAAIGFDVEFGAGTIVCSHCSITSNIKIGRHTHVNLNSTIGHDCRIGNYVTISPLVALSGRVTVEDEVNFGTGSCVIPGVRVGHGSVVGAGAAVTRDIDSRVVAVGVPARVVRERS